MIDNVKRGAAWLDGYRPEWYRLIDLDTLDLGSCRKCILGQLMGEFVAATITLLEEEAGPPRSLLFAGGHEWFIEHGFYSLMQWDCDVLTSVWKNEILERRKVK